MLLLFFILNTFYKMENITTMVNEMRLENFIIHSVTDLWLGTFPE